MFEEKRKFKRIASNVRVGFRKQDTDKETEDYFQGIAEDCGLSGMFLTTEHLMPKGSIVTLNFQFTDNNSIHGYVYTATGYKGTPTETDEADPIWCPVDNLPYDRMWEDDHTWIPHMLAGNPFCARYIFDDDHMLDAVVDLCSTDSK